MCTGSIQNGRYIQHIEMLLVMVFGGYTRMIVWSESIVKMKAARYAETMVIFVLIRLLGYTELLCVVGSTSVYYAVGSAFKFRPETKFPDWSFISFNSPPPAESAASPFKPQILPPPFSGIFSLYSNR
jgi:hypothetical protein